MTLLKYLSILTICIFFISCSASRKAAQKASSEKPTKIVAPGDVGIGTAMPKTFSAQQQKLILEKDTTAGMRVFLITSKSDSILLRKKCEDVVPNPNDPVLQHFVRRLYKTVTDSLSMGVGIAAPQVGILKNIIWVQRFDKDGFPFEVYLNPKIKQYTKKKQPCPEGCLSIPNKQAVTQNRAYAILLEYDRMDGSHHVEMVEDFTAVIFQHEIDHLYGILFTDHLEQDIKDAKVNE